MDFGARRLVFLGDRGAGADETAPGRRHVDNHLALLRVVDGLGQIDFPDSDERFALFVLRHQTRATLEHDNRGDESLPGHFHPPWARRVSAPRDLNPSRFTTSTT